MRQLVLDAGPLIGLFYAQDSYHTQCVEGFDQLAISGIRSIVPLPIAFEVYKWMLQKTYTASAHQALRNMDQSFSLLPIDAETFTGVQGAIAKIPNWQGSLEDATVMVTAIQYRCPIWTYNFRDFSIFQSLEFWNP